jgi:hypothetical protein
MRFNKIKLTKDGKVHLEYQVKAKKGGSWDDFSFTCSDEPKPEFRNALIDLAQDVIKMCELPEDYLGRIVVKGVSFSWGGEAEVMGAVIVAQMSLRKSNIPLNLNTPHKPSEPYSEGADESQLLSDDCVGRLEDLIKEAEDYVKGIRAQGNLFPEKTETAERTAPSA